MQNAWMFIGQVRQKFYVVTQSLRRFSNANLKRFWISSGFEFHTITLRHFILRWSLFYLKREIYKLFGFIDNLFLRFDAVQILMETPEKDNGRLSCETLYTSFAISNLKNSWSFRFSSWGDKEVHIITEGIWVHNTVLVKRLSVRLLSVYEIFLLLLTICVQPCWGG